MLICLMVTRCKFILRMVRSIRLVQTQAAVNLSIAKHDPHHTTVEPVWWLLMDRRPPCAWSPTTTMMMQSSQHKSMNPKSCLNLKTASIAHFNFRAKWHQQNHCGEASVKPKSWVPHRFPTVHTYPGHKQGDHSRCDYAMDLEIQKSHTKIIFPCFLCAIKHLKGLM